MRDFLRFVLFVHLTAATVVGQETFSARVADLLGAAQKCAALDIPRCAPVIVGEVLGPMTFVKTGPNAAVLLQLPQGHVFRIGGDTTVRLNELGQHESFSFGLIEGWIWSFVSKASKPAKYEIETPSTILGVSGTVFSAFHSAKTGITTASADGGTVTVKHATGTVTVAKGYQTHIHRDEPHPVQVEKHDAEHRKMWALMHSHESWMRVNGSMQLHPHMPRHLGPIHAKLQSKTG